MKKILLIGDPVFHSLSPGMQNAAFKELGLDLKYESLRITENKFEMEIKNILEARDILGANITAPFKTRILPFVKTSELAVNTIKRGKRGFLGFNTDIFGIKMLLKNIGFSNKLKVLILGGGGGAIAAKKAVEDLGGFAIGVSRRDTEWENIESIAFQSDIVINATGSDNFDFNWERVPEKIMALDLRYPPPKSAFLKNAEAASHKGFNGLKILLYQGAKSFEIWTGQKAPLDVMSRSIGLA